MVSNHTMKQIALILVLITFIAFVSTVINMIILLIHNPWAILYVILVIIISYLFVWSFGNCWRYYDHKETHENAEGDFPQFKLKFNVFKEKYISRTF